MSRVFPRLVTPALLSLSLAACTPPAPDEPVISEGIQPCPSDIAGDVEQTIGTQIDAFEREDFPAAYAMAAPDFQSGVTLEEFEALIRRGFVPLMNVETFGVSQCVWDPDLSQVEIGMTLTTNSGVVGSLRYLLVSTPEGWRIQGAVPNQQSQQGT